MIHIIKSHNFISIKAWFWKYKIKYTDNDFEKEKPNPFDFTVKLVTMINKYF